MTLKNFYIAPIKGYQYISKMLPASCRYYPTCSEYAKWQYDCNSPIKATWATATRILRCNQMFTGGIDYPLIAFTPQKTSAILIFNAEYGKIEIDYWLVPKGTQTDNTDYYILKDFDAIKHTT